MGQKATGTMKPEQWIPPIVCAVLTSSVSLFNTWWSKKLERANAERLAKLAANTEATPETVVVESLTFSMRRMHITTVIVMVSSVIGMYFNLHDNGPVTRINLL